jgi:hypothetical protein
VHYARPQRDADPVQSPPLPFNISSLSRSNFLTRDRHLGHGETCIPRSAEEA